MDKTRKWRKILAMMLTVVMMLQNVQSVIVSAGVTTEEIEARLNGQTQQTQEQQPSESQVETRANGETYQTQQQTQQQEEQQESQQQDQQTAGSSSGDASETGISDGSQNAGNNADAQNDTTKISNANVSATITQSIFQEEISGGTYNFAQMTAKITNNDTENAATGVQVTALLPSQLSYINEYGKETSGIFAYAAPYQAQASGCDLSAIPSETLDTYANSQIALWVNQTIGAGETAEYSFAVQIQDGVTDVSGMDTVWYVNGTKCSYSWENAELLTPAQTPEATEEPEVTETPEETPAPEVTETPEETPAPEVTEAPEETATPEPTQAVEDNKKAKAAKKKQQQKLMAQRGMEDEIAVQDADGENAQPTVNADRKNIANNDITFSFEVDNEPYDGELLSRDATIDIKMTYTFKPENQPTEADCTGYYYDLPDLTNLKYDLPEEGSIQGESGRAGSWTRNGNRITFNYDPKYIEAHSEEGYGTFHMWSKIDKESVTRLDKFDVVLGNQTTTINLENTPLEGTKTYSVDEDGNLVFKIVLTADDADADNVFVTDTLTGNLQFAGADHFKVTSGKTDITSQCTINIKGQVATISGFKVEYGKPVTIEYVVTPNTAGDSEIPDSNTASWTWGKGTGDAGQESGTTGKIDIDLNNNTLTKSGTVIENQNQINYTVNINEFGLQLLKTPGGMITVVDTIHDEENQVGLEIVRSSIKLVDKSGNNIADSNIVYTPTELTITIPDATAAVLTYTVQMSGIPDKTKGKIKNVAILKGQEEKPVETVDDVVIVKASATYDGVAKTVKIKKYGKYLVNGAYPSLSGATFELWKCNPEAEDQLQDTQTTVDGVLQFKNVSTRTLYYIKEKNPPKGYQLNDTPIYFVTYSKASEKDSIKQEIESAYQNKIDVGQIRYEKDGLVLEIEDEPVPTSDTLTIEAEKTIKGQQASGTNFSFNMKFVKYQPQGTFVKGDKTSAYSVQENAQTYDDTQPSIDGKIEFNPITFGYEGIYTFAIKEIQTEPDKYFYDDTVYEVKVTVKNVDGHLKATKEIIPDKQNNKKIVFNNIEKTDFTLQKKTAEPVNEDVSFKFVLSSEDNDLDFRKVEYSNTDDVVETFNKNEKSATLVLKVKKGTSGSKVTLKNLPVGADIKVEETELPDGWSLTSSGYSPSQKITLNNTDINEISVSNEYKEDGSVRFEVSKEFNDWRQGRSFTFELKGLSMKVEAGNKLTEIPMPASSHNNISTATISYSSESGDARSAQFGNVSYTVNGDYYYELKEQIPDTAENNKENGITYDSEVTYIQVHVENGAGGKKKITVYTSEKTTEVGNESYKTLTTKPVSGLTASATFTNVYEASTTVQFKGTKAISGRDLKDTDKFTFEVSGGNLESPVTKQNNGSDINFDPIEFTQDDLKGATEKTFIFHIKEVEPTTGKIAGITYDNSTYEVQVKVTKNADGTLSAIVVGAGNPDGNGVYSLPNAAGKSATFVNTYGASAGVTFIATKGLSNKSLEGNDFTFKIVNTDTNPNDVVAEARNGADSQDNDKHKIQFPTITYSLDQLETAGDKKTKTFHYKIIEDCSATTNNKLNGVTYDPTEYPVTVVVTDDGNGELTITCNGQALTNGQYTIPVAEGKTYNFENTYDASTSIKFVGNKKLENKALAAGQFKFTIKGSNVPGNTGSEEVSNDENGNFESSTISYNLTDLDSDSNRTDYTKQTFEYKISEVTSGDDKQPGISYDKTEYTVYVTVTNDTTTGQLVPTAKAGTTDLDRTRDATGTWIFTLPKQNKEATFINTYGAQTEVQLAATKELKNKALEANKYSFSITQTNNDSGFASTNPGTILSSKGLGTEATVKNGAESSDPKDIKFPTLQYKITDLKKSDGTYADSRTFHYTISENDGTEGGVTYSDQHYYVDVKVTDNGEGDLKEEVRVSTDSSKSFDEKTVITPNNDVYSLTSSNNYSFTNIYEASTKVQLTGIKKLVNNDKDKTGRKLKDVSYGTKSFSFEITGPKLKDEDGKDVKSRTVEIQTTDKDTDTAVFAFPEITYDVTDLGGKNSEEFKYTIIEKAPQDSKDTKGITYDNSEYTAIVTVTDNKNGTLSSSVKLQKKGAEETQVDGNEKNGVAVYALTGSEPTFTNRYDASGSYEFKVNKTLAGRKFQEGDNFNFQIVKTDGNKEEVIGTLSLKADGNLPAEKLTGILAKEEYGLSDVGKTYKYSIQELNPENKMNGVTVSDQRYIIYVKVTDNNDGTLKSEAEWRREVNGKIETITFDEEHEAVIDFQNVYEADGTAQIVAQKTLSPLKLEDNNSQFRFVLTRVDADGKELTGEDAYTETVSNKGSAIVFTPITYNQNDVGKDFYYTVKEIAGKDKGYAYSKDVYNVHVTVSIDKQDNHKLITTKEITDATGATQDAIVFANTYEAAASVTLEGKKEIVDSTGKAIENATLEDGKFTFTVKDENGTIVSTGKNDTDGKITFTPIEYKYSKESNPLGEHIYTVTEDQPEAGDQYIYDHNSRTVVVNVADNGDGTLTASVVTDPDKSDAISGEKCFRNEVISLKFRKTDLTKADTDADKTLAGATLKLSEYDTANKKAGTEIAQWTTANEDYTVNGLIAGTTYILEEIAAPEGYTTADPIIFTIKNDEKRSVEVLSESGQLDETGKTVIMSDAKTGVTVLKVDNDGKGVSGAKLAILDGETVKAEWTSDGQPKYIEGLIAGKEYVLRELSAPAGYRKAEDVKFTVEDGKTTSVKMVDVQTTVSILKVDEKGNALSGAILEVRDKASNTLIDRWETDGKAHTISGLTEGETYILSEISAPDGYTLAKPQEFTLDTTKPVTEIKMENKQNSVTISKKALTGTDSIAGAVLRVLDATGKEVVPKWTTEAGKDKVVTGVLKPNVTYTLEEVSAPSGYAKADNITFAVDEDGVLYVNHEKATSVVMRDAQLRLCVSKTDITGKAELPGAVLQIIEKDTKTVVDEWTTTTTPHYTDKGLVSGKTYLLHEKTAPAGYAYAEDVEFTLRNDSVVGSEQKVTMYDAPNTVVITKTDLTGKELAGAKLQILDTNGKVLESWTSSTEEHRVEASLEAGKEYILHEVEAPEGYVLAEDVRFTVNKDGSTTRVAMKDAPTGVNISKTDLTGSKEIAGAVLQVLDKNGVTVEQWTSDGTTHTVESKLVAGETYILHEVSAPAGYRTAKDIEFTVDKTGKTTKVVMKDAPTQASILKTDQNGKGLAGATLAVKDSTGKVLEQWTSDGSAHVIEGLLTVGQTYTLSEISAPAGYTVAPDQTFTMEDKDVIEVTMVDTQETTGSGQITVTKKVSLVKGGDIIDMIANDDTFYVNIFTDAAGKYPYKGAKPQAIHLVNASAGSVTFDGLGTGTYYVYETDADGNVISLDTDSTHNGVQFMCTVDGGTNSVTLDLKAGAKEGVVNLDNMFYDIPDGYSYKANISINKQVLKGTDQTTVDDTFYAGIFTKDDDGVYNLFRVVELVQNDTVTVEVPLGGDDGTQPINYYVLETDADGNILDLDVFEYEVSGEGTVALSVDNTTGNINLVNKVPEEKNGKLRVQKVDENGVGLAGASFRLTNADGEVVEEWTSEASAHELELEPGAYTLTEVQAPDGYTGEGSLTITVDEDYNFTVDGQIEYSYKDDLIKVVNKSVAPTPTPEVTPGVTPGPNGGTTTTTSSGGGSTPVSYSTLSGKVAVKTGDNTPIGAYVLILVVAAAAIAGGVVYKKKRRKDK